MPAERLLELVAGHRVTAVIRAAVETGVVDALAQRPLNDCEVATICATHAGSTGRLLCGLIAIGICTMRSDHRYQLTEIGALLASNSDPSFRDWALFESALLAPSWLGLGESVRSGRTAAELSGSAGGRYDEVGRTAETTAMFDAAMVSMTRFVARAVLATYEFRDAGSILDVGGGTGALLVAILRANPAATGAVLDLARCEVEARRAIGEAGLEGRADFMAGDFFAGLPSGFDTLLLKSVLHNWDDGRCALILANCRRALSPRGRILIVERFLERSEVASSRFIAAALSDLNMLRGPGGRERSEIEYRDLLGDAGLRVVGVLPAGPCNVIVAAT